MPIQDPVDPTAGPAPVDGRPAGPPVEAPPGGGWQVPPPSPPIGRGRAAAGPHGWVVDPSAPPEAWTVPGRPHEPDAADGAVQGRWGIPDALLGGVIWFVLSNVLGLVVIAVLAVMGTIEITADMDSSDLMSTAGVPLLVATAVSGLMGFVGWAWVVGRWKGTGSLRRDQGLAFRWADLGWGVLGGIASLVLSAVISIVWTVSTGGDAPTNTDDILGTATIGPGAALVMLVCVGIAVPFAEEVFFRGLLLGSIRKRSGVWPAVVISSMVFGLLHAFSGAAISEGLFVAGVTATFGVVFALLRVLIGRLGPAIVAHMLNNSVSVVVVVAQQWA